MYHIKILSVGKTKEQWLLEAIEDYDKRLKSTVSFTYQWAKNDHQLEGHATKEKNIILLDPQGVSRTSEQFSSFLVESLERGGSKLTFVIGGADGIPKRLLDSGQKISFSPLTFTHQMCRLILVEQIYRALEIDKGSDYHRA